MNLERAQRSVTAWGDGWVSWLCALPVPALAIVTLLYVATVNGIWLIPNIDHQWMMSRDLTVNPFADDRGPEYLLTSYLLPVIAHALGLSASITAFAVASAIVLLSGYVAAVIAVRHRFGDDVTRVLLFAFACLPISNILATFIGASDALVWSLTTLIVACRAPALRCVLAVLLAVSHREQSGLILAFLSLVLPLIEDDRPAWPALAALWAGCAAGVLLLALHFWWHGFVIVSTRWGVVRDIAPLQMAVNPLRQAAMTAVSLFAVYWPAVMLMLIGVWQHDRRAARRFVACWVTSLAVIVLTVDQTRVFAVLSWPAVMVLVVLTMREPANRGTLTRLSAWLVIIGLILPRPILFNGQVHSSALLATAGYVTEMLGLTHWMGNVNRPRLAPFRVRWEP